MPGLLWLSLRLRDRKQGQLEKAVRRLRPSLRLRDRMKGHLLASAAMQKSLSLLLETTGQLRRWKKTKKNKTEEIVIGDEMEVDESARRAKGASPEETEEPERPLLLDQLHREPRPLVFDEFPGLPKRDRCIALPSLEFMAQIADLPKIPDVGDVFVSKGERREPVCIEYTAPAPHGKKIREYAAHQVFVAKEVKVVMIPADKYNWEKPGIAVRVDSIFEWGSEAWVNVTRERELHSHGCIRAIV